MSQEKERRGAEERRKEEVAGGEKRERIEGLTWDWMATSRVFTVKKIPKAVRLLWADVVSKVLKGVVMHTEDSEWWLRLLALPKLCLRMPPRGGKKKQRAFQSAPHLQRLLRMALDERWQELFDEAAGQAGKKKGQGGRRDEKRDWVWDT